MQPPGHQMLCGMLVETCTRNWLLGVIGLGQSGSSWVSSGDTSCCEGGGGQGNLREKEAAHE